MQYWSRDQFLVTKITPKNYMIEKNVLICELKPLLWTLRFMGLLPYTLAHNDELKIRVLSPIFLYSMMVVFPAITLGGMVQFESIQRLIRNQDFKDNITSLMVLIFFATLPIIPFTHWLELNKKVKFLNSWKQFQISYTKTTGRTLELGLKRWTIFAIILTIGVTFTFILLLVISEASITVSTYFPVLYASSLLTLMPATWVIFCRAIRIAAKKSIQQLQESTKRNCSALMINNYKNLWLNMCFLSHDFGESMGLTFGGQTLVYFMYQVVSVFTFLFSMRQRDGITVISGFASVLVGFLIFFQCNSAHAVTQELGYKFMRMLHNLEQDFSSLLRETRYEIKIFLETVKTTEPVITYCGFVHVNRSLQVSLFSTLVTYLVVLMQFEISEPVS